jgi:membrane protease YdiL (CAAX protease family)
MEEQSASTVPDPPKFRIESAQAFATVGAVLLFGAFPLFGRDLVIATCAALLVLTALGWCMRWQVALPVSAFSSSCVALALLGLPSQLWFAIGLAAYAAALRRGPRRGVARWFTAGALTREVGVLMAGAVLASAITLTIWFFSARPDISDLVVRFLPDWPLPFLVFGGLVFSMLNAAVEELAYRGVLMDALEKTIGAGTLSLVGQAAAFGILHINGFPRGWPGVALAFIFGVLMGVVRRRSGGLAAPWAAHVGTDIVIVTLVVAYAKA